MGIKGMDLDKIGSVKLFLWGERTVAVGEGLVRDANATSGHWHNLHFIPQAILSLYCTLSMFVLQIGETFLFLWDLLLFPGCPQAHTIFSRRHDSFSFLWRSFFTRSCFMCSSGVGQNFAFVCCLGLKPLWTLAGLSSLKLGYRSIPVSLIPLPAMPKRRSEWPLTSVHV